MRRAVALMFRWALLVAPDLARGADHELCLRFCSSMDGLPTMTLAKPPAAQRQVVERDVLDARRCGARLALRLELARLGRDEAHDDTLSLGT